MDKIIDIIEFIWNIYLDGIRPNVIMPSNCLARSGAKANWISQDWSDKIALRICFYIGSKLS